MIVKVATKISPRLTKWHVHRALEWIGSVDTAGLQFVELIDEEPDDPQAIHTPAYIRGFLYNGRYFRKGVDNEAHIFLYTRDLYLGVPALLKWTSLATLRIAFTLAHEIGHHVIATRGFIFEPSEKYQPWESGKVDPFEERMADAYARKVIQRMTTSWRYKLGKLLTRMVSGLLLGAGIHHHSQGNYEEAASYNFRAFMIDPDNLDAGQAYRRDTQLLKSRRP